MMAPWSGIVVLAKVAHRPTETFGGDARTSRKRPYVDGREPGLQSVLRMDSALSTPRFGEQWTRIAILAIASSLLNARFVNGERSMILVDLTHTFPVSVGDAFAYITDTGNWKAFLPNFVRLHDPTQAKGDTQVGYACR